MHNNHIDHIRSSTKRKCHGHPSWRRDRQGFFSLYLCLIKTIYSICFLDATDDLLASPACLLCFLSTVRYSEITCIYFWYRVTNFIFIQLFLIRCVYLFATKWTSISDIKFKYNNFRRYKWKKNFDIFLCDKTNCYWNMFSVYFMCKNKL